MILFIIFCSLFTAAIRSALAADQTATKIVIQKAARTLTLFHESTVLRSYTVSLGRTPAGAKERQGDGKTPEGLYRIDSRNEHSKFFRALHVSYPNEHDRKRAKERGLNPGGDIMIHGMKNGFGWIGRIHRLIDWSDGCIAVTDEEMLEIWKLVPTGTPVQIDP